MFHTIERTSIRRRLLASAAGAVALLALAGAAPAAPPSGGPTLAEATSPAFALRLVPRALDLGDVAAGTVGRGEVLVLNEGPEPILIDGVQAGCGCTRVNGFAAFELAPGEGRMLEVEMDAPNPGEDGLDLHATKSTRLRILSSGRPVAEAEVRVRRAASAHEPRLVLDAAPAEPLPVGGVLATRAWLVLPLGAEGPVEIGALKAGCDCTTVPDLTGLTVARAGVVEIPLAIDTAKARPGVKRVTLRVVLHDGRRLEREIAFEVAPAAMAATRVRSAGPNETLGAGGC